MATYTKGGSADEWIFPGSLNVTGTFTTAGPENWTIDATEEAIQVDAYTTPHTGANIIDIRTDVNSASVKVLNADINVTTALSTGEKVYGAYIDINGKADDHGDSEFAAFYATSANTTASTNNSGVQLAGTFDTGIKLGSTFTADGILISGGSVDAIHVSGAASANGINLAGTAVDGILIAGATTDAIHVSGAASAVGLHLANTAVDGVLIDGACTDAIHVSGAVTTGLNVQGSAMTTGISIGLTGKTYATGIACGVTGGTLTTGMSVVGAMTTGINFTSAVAIGTLINATAACAHLATRGVFIGADSNTEGSGIALNGAAWETSQANALYSDDGGVAATGYTETFTVRHLTTATVASGDVSFVAIHPDMYLNADYTGTGGISAIWGNTTIATGKTINLNGSLGDVGGASFGIDIVGTLAANSHACGCSVGVGGSGTKSGILSGFRVRGATGTVDWDAFLSIEDGDGSWTSMTTAGNGKTPSLGTAGPTGSDSAPTYWLNIYIGETKYYFPVWASA